MIECYLLYASNQYISEFYLCATLARIDIEVIDQACSFRIAEYWLNTFLCLYENTKGMRPISPIQNEQAWSITCLLLIRKLSLFNGWGEGH
jgi:hypothetical protein